MSLSKTFGTIRNIVYTGIIATALYLGFQKTDANIGHKLPSNWKPIVDKTITLTCKTFKPSITNDEIKTIIGRTPIYASSPRVRWQYHTHRKFRELNSYVPLTERILYYIGPSEGNYESYNSLGRLFITFPAVDTIAHEFIHSLFYPAIRQKISQGRQPLRLNSKVHHTFCSTALDLYIKLHQSDKNLIKPGIKLKPGSIKNSNTELKIIEKRKTGEFWYLVLTDGKMKYIMERTKGGILLREKKSGKRVYSRQLSELPNISSKYPGSANYMAFRAEHNLDRMDAPQTDLAYKTAENAVFLEQCLGLPGAGFTYFYSIFQGADPLHAERDVVFDSYNMREWELSMAKQLYTVIKEFDSLNLDN